MFPSIANSIPDLVVLPTPPRCRGRKTWRRSQTIEFLFHLRYGPGYFFLESFLEITLHHSCPSRGACLALVVAFHLSEDWSWPRSTLVAPCRSGSPRVGPEEGHRSGSSGQLLHRCTTTPVTYVSSRRRASVGPSFIPLFRVIRHCIEQQQSGLVQKRLHRVDIKVSDQERHLIGCHT